MKVAPTVLDEFIVRLQVFPTTASQPVQLLNDANAEGVGVIETDEPAVNEALQEVEQLIPAGELAILPPEEFVTEAFTGYAKFACTVFTADAVIVHELPLGASQFVQFTKVPPAAGVAVNTTTSL